MKIGNKSMTLITVCHQKFLALETWRHTLSKGSKNSHFGVGVRIFRGSWHLTPNIEKTEPLILTRHRSADRHIRGIQPTIYQSDNMKLLEISCEHSKSKLANIRIWNHWKHQLNESNLRTLFFIVVITIFWEERYFLE